MSPLSLLEIQRLQFTSREDASRELLSFLRARGVADVVGVQVNPKPESLNSVNGFVDLSDGDRLFFKTHVEEEEKLGEYYKGQLLHDAGYPVVTPERVRSVPGEQIVFYRPITYPTLFDLVKSAEDIELGSEDPQPGGAAGPGAASIPPPNPAVLIRLQRALDARIAELYRETVEVAPADEGRASAAPIHQLFSHRLRDDGRYGLFYGDGTIVWNGTAHRCRDLFAKRWVINGVRFPATIDGLVRAARSVLPSSGEYARTGRTLSVLGHGDAHNGNVFVDLAGERLLYFDPAFAGRHDPVLDLVKPLFHNIFARWMYHPLQVAGEVDVDVRIADEEIVVEHDFTLSPLRRAFLDSKLELLLPAVSSLLTDHGADRELARDRLRAALLCCPLLTVNLAAAPDTTGPLGSRYPSVIRFLALSLALEVGARADGAQTAVSALVSRVEQALAG